MIHCTSLTHCVSNTVPGEAECNPASNSTPSTYFNNQLLQPIPAIVMLQTWKLLMEHTSAMVWAGLATQTNDRWSPPGRGGTEREKDL